ncbi:MAG: hypothetical protein HY763_09815 [Planctomycetes bacterium]|nr:hypothetical protein [Planctomycetota bacterium]
MKSSVKWFTLAAGMAVTLGQVALAQTPTLKLVAVEVNDVPCAGCPTSNLTGVAPGDVIRVDAYVEGWDDQPNRGVCSGRPNQPGTPFGSDCTIDQPGACGTARHCSDSGSLCTRDGDCNSQSCIPSQCIKAPQIASYQWTLDGGSLHGATCGELTPALIPCLPDDCSDIMDGLCPCAQYYQFTVQCTCAFNGSCNVTLPDGDYCDPLGTAFVELARPDFLFFGLPTLMVVNPYTPPNIEWGGTVLSGGAVDPLVPRYLGTILLQASPNAQGTYTLRMLDDAARTFVNDQNANTITQRTLVPLTIDFGTCCPGTNCADTNLCTIDCVDSCDTCVCTHENKQCPFGQVCNPATGLCVVECTPQSCTSTNPCVTAACVGSVCTLTNNSDPCNDGNPCTVNDVCGNGNCTGTAKDCNDNNICTNDSCVAGNCVNAFNTVVCNDNNACTTNDRCNNGVCTGTQIPCNDNNACTDDSCNSGLCVFTNNTAPCTPDTNLCTDDVCAGGTCTHPPKQCPPGQQCNPANGNCETTGCPAFTSGDPPNCEIDGRQPHPVSSTTPAQGVDRFNLTFPQTCTLAPSDFTLSVAPGPAPGGFAISQVNVVGNVATVVFNQVIPTKNWTCVMHNASGKKHCLGFLPADVNKSRASNAQDITALVNSLNNAVPRPLLATDANRSGAANAQDIAAVVNLLNGASAFDPWLNVTIPVACPSP